MERFSTEEPANVTRRALIDALASTLVATLFAGLLTLVAAYFRAPSGALVIGQRMAVPGRAQFVVPIEIANYRDDEGLELALEVPLGIAPSSISTSRPVQIVGDSIAATGERTLLRVRGLPARSTTRLLVPVDSAVISPDILARNSSGERLEISYDRDTRSRLARAIGSVFGGVLAYLVAYFVLNFAFLRWYLPKHEELKRRIAALEHSSATTSDELRRERSVIENRLGRIRTLLLSRIMDLQRELEFWRNTVRRYVLDSGRTVAEADDLLTHVSDQLHTWSTRADAPSTASIRIAAAMLEDGDRQIDADVARTASPPAAEP